MAVLMAQDREVLLRRSWRARFWHAVAAVLYWPRRNVLWKLGALLDHMDRRTCAAYGWANNRTYDLEDHDDLPF
jgi:hypothetical protein